MVSRRYGVLAAVFLAFLAYAIVRYNVFKEVPWEHLPLYVTNKALSWAGLALLGLSLVVPRRPPTASEAPASVWYAVAGFCLVLLHVLISLILLTPHYYSKLFGDDGKLNLVGETSLLAGALALAGLVACQWIASAMGRGSPSMAGRRVLREIPPLLVLLGGLHCGIMGYAGWLTPGAWPGGLPPITMLGAAAAALAVLGWVVRTGVAAPD
ncbi:MAG: hypothetical protein GF320_16800 [Armatimonadia bacterium]|nr:hypothetical protein [Armatimonadia bacterium]